jgi:predicted transcriptional regulator
MKSVLISTRPEWCELIASGKKTVEIRKTKPKLETPFKAYIYCTIGDGAKGDILPQSRVTCGKVIGEFVCDRIEEIGFSPEMHGQYICRDQSFIEQSCVPFDEMFDYLDEEYGYGWHISDLVIYDHPKELSEFCSYDARLSIDENGFLMPTHAITRPPQSWRYAKGGE